MSKGSTNKKVTRVGSKAEAEKKYQQEAEKYTITEEGKSKAKKFRIIAAIAFFLALISEVVGIFILNSSPVNTTWLIVMIVVALAFSVVGSILWKKANRSDPASKKEKIKFFVQNQLGAILAVVTFLPLVILTFTNKDLSGKQKGLVGTIAIIAMLVAGAVGVDLEPPSLEDHQNQLEQIDEQIDGGNSVYWTVSGKSYHLFLDCSYINGVKTTEIFQGTIADARKIKKITDICDRCERRAKKEESTLMDMVEEETDMLDTVVAQ